jgi:2'-5' RNA ligase
LVGSHRILGKLFRVPARLRYFLRVVLSKRLFVGLELPPSCKSALFGLDPHLAGLRWLSEEQLHLTLSFIGEVEASAYDRLDLKPFHPHVTVGRANGISNQALQPFMRIHAETEFGLVNVTGFGLYSSVLAATGAIHSLEMRQEF